MVQLARAAQQPSDQLWVPTWAAAAGEKTIAARSAAVSSTEFYCSWFCPYAQRAWIALEEKGVNYRYMEINPYEVDDREPGGYTKRQLPLPTKRELFPGFVECSPRGLVPALDHAGEKVWESLVLVEYIDERFKGPPLLPTTDAHARAKARAWVAHCDLKIQKPYYTMLMEQEPSGQEAAKKQMFDGCRELARAMSPLDEGPFFAGAQFGLLDIALAPFWHRYRLIGGHYRGLEFPSGKSDKDFLRLEHWWEAVRHRPSVAATIVCDDRLICSYSDYARNKGTSDYAKSIQSSLSKTARQAQPTGSMKPALGTQRAAVIGLGAFALGAALGGATMARVR